MPMLVGDRGRAVLSCIPRDRVLPESDGPFVKNGSHTIMPWDVKKVVDGLGKQWAVGSQTATEIVEENYERLIRQV
jgi:TatD DNase family protein